MLTATFQSSRRPDGQPHEIIGTLEYETVDCRLRTAVESLTTTSAKELPEFLDKAAEEVWTLAKALNAAHVDGEFLTESMQTEFSRRLATLQVVCQLFDVSAEARECSDLNIVVESAVGMLERSQLNVAIAPVLSQTRLPVEADAAAILRFLLQVTEESVKGMGHRGSMVIQTCPIGGAGAECGLLSIEIRGSSLAEDQIRAMLAGVGGATEIVTNAPLGSTVRITWPLARVMAPSTAR
jgi:hypothetical protein